MEENNNKESKTKINTNNIINIALIKYKKNNNQKGIRLFGDQFVENNKGNIKLTINNKEIEFCSILDQKQIEENRNIIEIKIEEIKTVTNASYMFLNCDSLISIKDFDKINTSNLTNVSHFFSGCSLLFTIPELSVFFTSISLFIIIC